MAFPRLSVGAADGILEKIKSHNKLWLAPEEDAFKTLSYTVRREDKLEKTRADKMSQLKIRRGTSQYFRIGAVVADPENYLARKRYEGKLEGKEVIVVDVTGPLGDSTGRRDTKLIVVVEKATWRPLVLLSGGPQYFFLDYVEAQPGQHVPLRVVLRYESGYCEEYRFQLADDRVWISEQYSRYGAGRLGAIENIKIDGKPAAKIRRCSPAEPIKSMEEFDLNRITDVRGETPEERVVAELLRRNRPWLNPSLDHLESVAFVHGAEQPLRQERFVWRRDGTSLLAVVTSGDDATSGKWWITTPDQGYYYHPPNDRFAHRMDDDYVRRYVASVPAHVRRNLAGSPITFGLLEWARTPQQVVVEGIARKPNENAYVIHLSRVGEGYRISKRLSVGFVFHERRAWPFWRPDLSIWRSEVHVDGNSFRPVKAIDHSSVQVRCEIEFLDYQEVGDGRAVQRRIRARFPQHNFDADYRFEWRPEGLWILKSAISRYTNRNEPPRVETIRDLKINQPVDDLMATEAAIVDTTRKVLAISNPGTSRTIAAFPFRLGKRMVFPADARTSPKPPIRSLLLTLDDDLNLVADIGFGEGPAHFARDDSILLALFDEAGRPTGTFQTPLAAAAFSYRSAASILEAIRARHAIWLAPDVEGFPDMTYDRCFHDGKTTKTEPQVLDRWMNRHVPWGEAMHFGLERMVARPREYRAPVVFEGRWKGTDVIVAAIAGPELSIDWGVDMQYYSLGNPATSKTKGLLIIEKATSNPLVVRYGKAEFHFLNYREVAPGQWAPFRVVDMSGDASYPSDFRFQIVDGKRWWFESSIYGANAIRRMRNLRINGAPVPVTRWSGPVTPVKELRKLDVRDITNRRSLFQPEDERIRDVIAREIPWEHPLFHPLLDVQMLDDPSAKARRVRVQLGKWPVLGDSRYVVLARRPNAESAAFNYAKTVGSAGQAFPVRHFDVPTYPFRLNDVLEVNVPGGKGMGEHTWNIERKTHIKRARFEENEARELLAKIEVISGDCAWAFDATVSALLFDGEDNPIAAGSGRFTRYVDLEIGSSDDVVLNLGRLAAAKPPTRVQLGLKLRYITAFAGSMWEWPHYPESIFPIEQYLGSDDPKIWKVGLDELDGDVRSMYYYELFRWDESERAVKEGKTRAKTLAPHMARLEALLKKADDPGVLSYLCRLLGHSGERRFRNRIKPFLDHPQPAVRDAAAVGLGLLGDASGFRRLRALFNRPKPSDRDHVAREALAKWQTDAALALHFIGSDSAVHLLGDALLSSVDAISTTSARWVEHGVDDRGLANLLGRTDNSLAMRYLRQALQDGDLNPYIKGDILHSIEERTSILAKILRKVITRIQPAVRGP